MDVSQVALAVYITLVSGLLGVLTWSRMGRLEAQIGDLRTEVKTDIAEFRAEFKSDVAELRAELKADISDLRTEFAGSRTEFAGLRSDLTLVALAVGVERPKPQSLG